MQAMDRAALSSQQEAPTQHTVDLALLRILQQATATINSSASQTRMHKTPLALQVPPLQTANATQTPAWA